MKLCPSCQRHALPSARACPFCATPLATTGAPARVGVVLGLALASCGPSVTLDDGGATGSSGSEGTGPSSATMSTSASTTVSPGTSDTTVGPGVTTDGTTVTIDDEEGDDVAGFYGPFGFDEGSSTFECDLIAQDCPEGEKCMPWSNDGGQIWNASRCSPLAPNPAQLGDPCSVEGSQLSGIDDCDLGLMCLGADPTGQGECVSLCADVPSGACEDASLQCALFGGMAVGACLPDCAPLSPAPCEGIDACLPLSLDDFHCVPHVGPGYGAYADECWAPTDCDAGHVCVLAAHVPGCTGDACCTTYCDPAQGDGTCPDAASGQLCTEIQPGVGACMLP